MRSLTTHELKLTDEEIVALASVAPRFSADAEAARRRIATMQAVAHLTDEQAAFVAKVVEYAKEAGKLVERHTSVRKCPVCGNSAGYHTYTRNSRYHRKGEPNYDKPKVLGAVDLADTFVRMSGYVTLGCCDECWAVVADAVKSQVAPIQCQLPWDIDGRPNWMRYENVVCNHCGWEGDDGSAKLIPAMMGGYFPGKCPECGEETGLGRVALKRRDGYTFHRLPRKMWMQKNFGPAWEREWKEVAPHRGNWQASRLESLYPQTEYQSPKVYGYNYRFEW